MLFKFQNSLTGEDALRTLSSCESPLMRTALRPENRQHRPKPVRCPSVSNLNFSNSPVSALGLQCQLQLACDLISKSLWLQNLTVAPLTQDIHRQFSDVREPYHTAVELETPLAVQEAKSAAIKEAGPSTEKSAEE